MHPGLISVYKALKYESKTFIQKCRDIAPERPGEPLAAARDGKELYNARLKEVFDRFKENTEMDQALRYFFINRTVFMGRINYKIPSRMYFSNPKGWNIVNTDRLEQAAKHLKNVEITRLCATALLKTEGKNVFCYLDPPYITDTELSKSSQLYEYSFTKEDHIRLAEEVKKCKHKILLSYDDDKNGIIRNLYKDFNIFEEEWTYSGTSSVNGEEKKKGKELLITNYDVSIMKQKEEEIDLFG